MTIASRRAVAKGALFGIPLAFIGANAAGAFTGSLTPQKSYQEILLQGSKNVRVSKVIKPSAKPSSGSRWYHGIQTRYTDNKNTITSMISYRDATHLSVKVEFVKNGVVSQKAKVDVPAVMFGNPFQIYVTVNGDEVLTTVWQNKKQIVRLPVSGASAFTGTTTRSTVWIEGNRPIDFAEVTNAVALTAVTSNQSNEPQGKLDYPGFKLRLNEEFTSSTLDTKYWNIRDSGNWLETGKVGPGSENYPSVNNNSLAIDRKENVEISNGTCKIWLRKIETPRLSPYTWGYTAGKKFTHTTGYIDTVGKVEGHFLRFEFRGKLPFSALRAIWGGGWLMNNKSYTKINGKTQLNGDNYFEIDLGEGYGKNELKKTTFNSADRVESTIHFAEVGSDLAEDPAHKKVARFSPLEPGMEDEWHIWAVEVTPKGVEFFYDNNPKPYHALYASEHPILASRLADKEQLFSIRLNLMTGNPYWNVTDSAEEIAKPLEIDYVRFWDYVG